MLDGVSTRANPRPRRTLLLRHTNSPGEKSRYLGVT